MSKPNYSYQIPLIDNAYKSLFQGKKVVLAACPGAGKTIMAIQIIRRFLVDHPKAKVLILTHGQMILRQQWARQLEDAIEIKPSSYRDKKLPSPMSIFIAIPQSHKKIAALMPKIDLLVVDEAHHYYGSESIDKVKNTSKPKYELLITGTPSKYIGDDDYKIIGTTIQELLEYNTLTDPTIQLIESSYDIDMKDYTEDMTLRWDVQLKDHDTVRTLEKIIDSLVERLSTKNKGNIEKTMVICATQRQASAVYSYLKAYHFNPVISISNTGDGEAEVELFKQDQTCNFLIVVNRGILGFDFPALVNIIDFTQSLNVNRIFQMLCRVVRKDPKKPDTKKFFLKVTAQKTSHYSYYVMSFVVALSSPRHYYTYATNNNRNRNLSLDTPVDSNFNQILSNRREAPLQSLPSLMTFQEIKEIDQGEYRGTRIIAQTNFKTVGKLLAKRWTLEPALAEAKKYSSRKEFSKKGPGPYFFLTTNYSPRILDQFWPMKRKRWGEHNADLVAEIIRDAKTMKDIYKHGTALYAHLKNDPRIAHLKNKYEVLTIEKAVEQVLACKKLGEYQKGPGRRARTFLRKKNKIHLVSKYIDKLLSVHFVSEDKIMKVKKLTKTMSVTAACKKVGVKYQTFYARTVRRKC